MRRTITTGLLSLLTLTAFSLLAALPPAAAQSGRGGSGSERSATLNVIVHAQGGSDALRQLTTERLMLFDGGIPQQIEYFRLDPTGAKVVLLVDSSKTLRADKPLLQKVAKAFIGELYEDDQMMVIGFNEQAEILADFSGDLKTLQNSVNNFRNDGFPKLYDALAATVEDAFRKQLGVNKRAVVLLSDGYDRDSQTKYESILATLLNENIVIYAFQAPDRTFGAIRARDTGPKPADAITGLVESTGGLLFKLDNNEEAIKANAKTIVAELRDRWFTLSYTPKGVNPINARRLLITSPDEKVSLRTKKLHPAQSR